MWFISLLIVFIAYQNAVRIRRFWHFTSFLRNRESLVNIYQNSRLALKQYLSSTFDRNTFVSSDTCNGDILTFYVGDQEYKLLIKRRKCTDFTIIFDILDQHDKSVKQDILPYMGPRIDFYGIVYCPKDFGYDSLTFVYLKDAETITERYTKHTPINL